MGGPDQVRTLHRRMNHGSRLDRKLLNRKKNLDRPLGVREKIRRRQRYGDFDPQSSPPPTERICIPQWRPSPAYHQTEGRPGWASLFIVRAQTSRWCCSKAGG